METLINLSLRKTDIESILYSLVFTNYIQERNGIENPSPDLVKSIIKVISQTRQCESLIFRGKENKVYLSKELFAKIGVLLAKDNQEEADTIDKQLELQKEVRFTHLN